MTSMRPRLKELNDNPYINDLHVKRQKSEDVDFVNDKKSKI